MSLPDLQEPTRLPCGHGKLDLTGPGCFVCEYERVQRERQEARERVASLEAALREHRESVKAAGLVRPYDPASAERMAVKRGADRKLWAKLGMEEGE